MATPRDVLDLPAPEGPSTATTSLDPLSVSLSWSLSRLAEVFTRAMLPGREPVPVRITDGTPVGSAPAAACTTNLGQHAGSFGVKITGAGGNLAADRPPA